MYPYRHVLIAIDYSVFDHAVLEKGLAIAKQMQATVSLLHVLDNIAMPDTAYGTRIALDTPTDNDPLEQEKRRFSSLAAKYAIAPECAWLIWGVPQQEIVHLSAQQAVDLIVVGLQHKHGLAVLLGNTANKVLQHTACDLLTVHLPDN
jgi:universal stress protein A